jgi:nitrogen regulatory protein P-II 1
MKKIEATIRPEKLEPVRTSLAEMGILGMTVTEVSGRGKHRGVALQWRAGEYRVRTWAGR